MFDIIDLCLSIPSNKESQVDLVMERVQQLVPYEAALIGVGYTDEHQVTKTTGIRNLGFDTEWLQLYQDRRYERIDPVIKMALDSCTAVNWKDVVATHGIDKDFVNLKRDFRLNNGITCGHIDRANVTQATVVTMTLPNTRLMTRFQYILEHIIPHIPAFYGGVHCELHKSIKLTARELEILRWVKEGKSSSVIGDILSISERTVKFHVASILRKFGVASRTQAVAKALQIGLLEL